MEHGTNACLLWSPQWRISCQSIKCNMFLTADVFFLSLLPFFCNMCLFIAVCLRQYCWSSVHVRYLIAVMINHRWSAALFSQAKHYVDLILWSLEIFCTSSKLQMDWLCLDSILILEMKQLRVGTTIWCTGGVQLSRLRDSVFIFGVLYLRKC